MHVSRTMSRATWKALYRMMRIAARETRKAALDTVIFGTGFVIIDDNGIRHVPMDQIRIDTGQVTHAAR